MALEGGFGQSKLEKVKNLGRKALRFADDVWETDIIGNCASFLPMKIRRQVAAAVFSAATVLTCGGIGTCTGLTIHSCRTSSETGPKRKPAPAPSLPTPPSPAPKASASAIPSASVSPLGSAELLPADVETKLQTEIGQLTQDEKNALKYIVDKQLSIPDNGSVALMANEIEQFYRVWETKSFQEKNSRIWQIYVQFAAASRKTKFITNEKELAAAENYDQLNMAIFRKAVLAYLSTPSAPISSNQSIAQRSMVKNTVGIWSRVLLFAETGATGKNFANDPNPDKKTAEKNADSIAIIAQQLEKFQTDPALKKYYDAITAQSVAKVIDPNLILALVYTETRFRDVVSRDGGVGPFQITNLNALYKKSTLYKKLTDAYECKFDDIADKKLRREVAMVVAKLQFNQLLVMIEREQYTMANPLIWSITYYNSDIDHLFKAKDDNEKAKNESYGLDTLTYSKTQKGRMYVPEVLYHYLALKSGCKATKKDLFGKIMENSTQSNFGIFTNFSTKDADERRIFTDEEVKAEYDKRAGWAKQRAKAKKK